MPLFTHIASMPYWEIIFLLAAKASRNPKYPSNWPLSQEGYMDITKLISDLGFPIVISLISICQINGKLDEILREIKDVKTKLTPKVDYAIN